LPEVSAAANLNAAMVSARLVYVPLRGAPALGTAH